MIYRGQLSESEELESEAGQSGRDSSEPESELDERGSESEPQLELEVSSELQSSLQFGMISSTVCLLWRLSGTWTQKPRQSSGKTIRSVLPPEEELELESVELEEEELEQVEVALLELEEKRGM